MGKDEGQGCEDQVEEKLGSPAVEEKGWEAFEDGASGRVWFAQRETGRWFWADAVTAKFARQVPST